MPVVTVTAIASMEVMKRVVLSALHFQPLLPPVTASPFSSPVTMDTASQVPLAVMVIMTVETEAMKSVAVRKTRRNNFSTTSMNNLLWTPS